MIGGYTFVDLYLSAAVVVDDVITKENLIEWGWARGPVKVGGLPTPPANPKALKYPYGYSNKKEADSAVRDHQAIELNGAYYVLESIGSFANHGSYGPDIPPHPPFRRSPWEKWYWVNNNWKAEKQDVINDSRFKLINLLPDGSPASNPTALELISAALTAPVDSKGKKGTPNYGYWVTQGGEKVDMTLWEYPYDIVVERNKIPGVGHQYRFKTLKRIGQWSNRAIGAFNYERVSFVVNFPNCEVGPNFCVRFEIDTDELMYYEHTPKRYMWATLLADRVFYAKTVRRIPMPRYQPRTATDNISCYVMNKAMVKRLVDALYNKDIYAKIKDMVYGDGANNLLSLKWFYGVRPNLSTTRTSKIVLGNVILDATSVPVYNGDFVQVYLGYVNVKREYNDYRDFTNVRYQVYIPMVGIIDLDPAQVVGKDLHLVYTVNLTDGSAVVTLAVNNYTVGGKPALTKTNGWYDTPHIIFTTSITYGYEIPLNVEAIRSASLMVGEVVAKAVIGGAAGAVAGSLPGAVIGAVGGAASGALDGGVQSTYSSGALTANSNVMGDFTPKLIRTVAKDVSGDISAVVGAPSGRVVKVGDARGYLKASMVYGTPSTTMQHADEIVNMLKEGIYIS
jgi:hypothetical protein